MLSIIFQQQDSNVLIKRRTSRFFAHNGGPYDILSCTLWQMSSPPRCRWTLASGAREHGGNSMALDDSQGLRHCWFCQEIAKSTSVVPIFARSQETNKRLWMELISFASAGRSLRARWAQTRRERVQLRHIRYCTVSWGLSSSGETSLGLPPHLLPLSE